VSLCIRQHGATKFTTFKVEHELCTNVFYNIVLGAADARGFCSATRPWHACCSRSRRP